MFQRVARCDGPDCHEENVIPEKMGLTAIVDDVPEGWILLGLVIGGQPFEQRRMMLGSGDPIFHSMTCLGNWALARIEGDEE